MEKRWVATTWESQKKIGGGEIERAMERERNGKNGEKKKWGLPAVLGNGGKNLKNKEEESKWAKWEESRQKWGGRREIK